MKGLLWVPEALVDGAGEYTGDNWDKGLHETDEQQTGYPPRLRKGGRFPRRGQPPKGPTASRCMCWGRRTQAGKGGSAALPSRCHNTKTLTKPMYACGERG